MLTRSIFIIGFVVVFSVQYIKISDCYPVSLEDPKISNNEVRSWFNNFNLPSNFGKGGGQDVKKPQSSGEQQTADDEDDDWDLDSEEENEEKKDPNTTTQEAPKSNGNFQEKANNAANKVGTELKGATDKVMGLFRGKNKDQQPAAGDKNIENKNDTENTFDEDEEEEEEDEDDDDDLFQMSNESIFQESDDTEDKKEQKSNNDGGKFADKAKKAASETGDGMKNMAGAVNTGAKNLGNKFMDMFGNRNKDGNNPPAAVGKDGDDDEDEEDENVEMKGDTDEDQETPTENPTKDYGKLGGKAKAAASKANDGLKNMAGSVDSGAKNLGNKFMGMFGNRNKDKNNPPAAVEENDDDDDDDDEEEEEEENVEIKEDTDEDNEIPAENLTEDDGKFGDKAKAAASKAGDGLKNMAGAMDTGAKNFGSKFMNMFGKGNDKNQNNSPAEEQSDLDSEWDTEEEKMSNEETAAGSPPQDDGKFSDQGKTAASKAGDGIQKMSGAVGTGAKNLGNKFLGMFGNRNDENKSSPPATELNDVESEGDTNEEETSNQETTAENPPKDDGKFGDKAKAAASKAGDGIKNMAGAVDTGAKNLGNKFMGMFGNRNNKNKSSSPAAKNEDESEGEFDDDTEEEEEEETSNEETPEENPRKDNGNLADKTKAAGSKAAESIKNMAGVMDVGAKNLGNKFVGMFGNRNNKNQSSPPPASNKNQSEDEFDSDTDEEETSDQETAAENPPNDDKKLGDKAKAAASKAGDGLKNMAGVMDVGAKNLGNKFVGMFGNRNNKNQSSLPPASNKNQSEDEFDSDTDEAETSDQETAAENPPNDNKKLGDKAKAAASKAGDGLKNMVGAMDVGAKNLGNKFMGMFGKPNDKNKNSPPPEKANNIENSEEDDFNFDDSEDDDDMKENESNPAATEENHQNNNDDKDSGADDETNEENINNIAPDPPNKSVKLTDKAKAAALKAGDGVKNMAGAVDAGTKNLGNKIMGMFKPKKDDKKSDPNKKSSIETENSSATDELESDHEEVDDDPPAAPQKGSILPKLGDVQKLGDKVLGGAKSTVDKFGNLLRPSKDNEKKKASSPAETGNTELEDSSEYEYFYEDEDSAGPKGLSPLVNGTKDAANKFADAAKGAANKFTDLFKPKTKNPEAKAKHVPELKGEDSNDEDEYESYYETVEDDEVLPALVNPLNKKNPANKLVDGAKDAAAKALDNAKNTLDKIPALFGDKNKNTEDPNAKEEFESYYETLEDDEQPLSNTDPKDSTSNTKTHQPSDEDTSGEDVDDDIPKYKLDDKAQSNESKKKDDEDPFESSEEDSFWDESESEKPSPNKSENPPTDAEKMPQKKKEETEDEIPTDPEPQLPDESSEEDSFWDESKSEKPSPAIIPGNKSENPPTDAEKMPQNKKEETEDEISTDPEPQLPDESSEEDSFWDESKSEKPSPALIPGNKSEKPPMEAENMPLNKNDKTEDKIPTDSKTQPPKKFAPTSDQPVSLKPKPKEKPKGRPSSKKNSDEFEASDSREGDDSSQRKRKESLNDKIESPGTTDQPKTQQWKLLGDVILPGYFDTFRSEPVAPPPKRKIVFKPLYKLLF